MGRPTDKPKKTKSKGDAKPRKRINFVDLESGSWDGWGYTIKAPKGRNAATASEVKFIDVSNELSTKEAERVLHHFNPGWNWKLKAETKTKKHGMFEETGLPARVYLFKREFKPTT